MNETDQLGDLKEKLKKLESVLEKMQEQSPIYFCNIEHVEVTGPLLDNLEYKFDKLSVKEVSGALNVGNNFGVRVEAKKKKKEQSEKESEEKMKKNSKTLDKNAQPSDEKKAKDQNEKDSSDSLSHKKSNQMTKKEKEEESSKIQSAPNKTKTAQDGRVDDIKTGIIVKFNNRIIE